MAAAEHVATEVCTRLVDYLGAHTPPGTIAAAGAERGLARVCWVLAGLEAAYRSGGQLPADLAALSARPGGADVEDLRQLAGPAELTELVELAARVATSGALAALHTLTGHPPAGHPPGQALGHAGPVFIPHWADGDLLLGTLGATTLLEVKTVTGVRDESRVTRWLHQLLGYAWLDPTDRYRIRDVGLYLARHGVLLTWPLGYYTATLLDRTEPRVAAARRREFLTLATQVMTDEGADPTWLAAPTAAPAG